MRRDLTVWNPFSELQKSINSLFKDYERDSEGALTTSDWLPAIDIYENENEIVLKGELPGMTKDDVKIVFENDTLTISGEKKEDKEIKKEDYHRVERFYGSFSRSFRVPQAVDKEKFTAKFKDGILEINLPKTEEAKPKQIEINID